MVVPKGNNALAYFRALADLFLVLAMLSGLAWSLTHQPQPTPTPAPAPPLAAPPKPAPRPKHVTIRRPSPPPGPSLDRVVVARAEDALSAARRDRILAETRLAEAAGNLEVAETEAAKEALLARTLANRIRNPNAAIIRARARGEALRLARDRALADRDGLAAAPRPRRKSLIDKSPVARPIDGEEFHFEVRRGRVTFIDMERLIEKVKTDARLNLRLSDGRRPMASTVGPVGAFKMHYEMGRALPESIQEAIESRDITFTLRSWEIVPARDLRGETLDAIQHPASDFARAVNRLNPARSTITLWIYPDGFGLYRSLRDILHARGFTVAARPLPEGVPIRGSPAGSVSAGQ